MIPRLRKAWGESTQLFEAMNDLGKVKLTDQLSWDAGGRHVSVADGGHGDEGPPQAQGNGRKVVVGVGLKIGCRYTVNSGKRFTWFLFSRFTYCAFHPF